MFSQIGKATQYDAQKFLRVSIAQGSLARPKKWNIESNLEQFIQ